MFSNTNLLWLHNNTDAHDLVVGAIDSFQEIAGVTLHPVATSHLLQGSGYADDPFPRMEAHDNYLFAQLCFPSSVNDSTANFDELVLVATHDHALITVTSHESSEINWNDIRESTTHLTSQISSGCMSGNFLQILFRLAIDKMHQDATFLDDMIQSIAHDLLIGHDLDDIVDTDFDVPALSRRQQKELQAAAQSARPRISAIRHEMPGIKRVVEETENILEKIANDTIDLPQDINGNARELFTRDIEIHLNDIYVDARHVESMIAAIEAKLLSTSDRLRQIDSAEQVKANRFTGAIASIMLFPTFVVGLYGQNFEIMPELKWHYGYLFSFGIIAVSTALQVWFFRKRRWL
jgi:Mg2+ and Co2+ transporter CorA